MTSLSEPRPGVLASPAFRALVQALHLLAATVSVGVPFFLAVFMIPRLEAQGAAETIPDVVDRFYSVLPWVALAVFATTGLLNYLFWLGGSGYGPRESLGTSYVRALLVKVALAHVLVGLGIAFGLSSAMQENARTWAWVLFAVGVAIVLVSAWLRRSPAGARRLREATGAFEQAPLEARGGP
jgi:uncharacterized membrane protein